MNVRHAALVGTLAIAAGIAGCAPTEADAGAKVKANLTADTTLSAASIDVGVQKKVVTLTGTVDTAAIKEQALVVARRTEGVGEVVDQLVVRGHGAGPGHGRDMTGQGMAPGEHGRPRENEKRP